MSHNNNNKKLIIMGLKFGAWGYVLVVFSLFFMYVGHRVDEGLHTAPIFMVGLFIVAVILCIYWLFREVVERCR